MKKISTMFLRSVIYLISAGVLALCVFVLPRLIAAELRGDFDYGPIFVGMYLPAIPFFIGIYHALKLLHSIDTNNAFTDLSVTSLKYIKYCGFVISGLYAIGLSYIFLVAERDDAPGVVLIGLILTFAPLTIAIFAAVLQKFFQDAIRIKTENDLTV